jgi:iron complex outermembrane receptor protein
MVRHALLLFAASLASCLIEPAPARAAEDSHRASTRSKEKLEEVIVTADPLGGIDSHIARPVDVLDADALLQRDARSIGETVSRELGVSSSDFGPSVGRPIIRGLAGARVRVLEDGIGSMDVSTISVDHAVAVESVFAEQVEIFRGPATLLYGSGASGGLVNVSSNRVPSQIPAESTLDLYGHYDTGSNGWQGAAELETGAGPFALHADGMKRDSDDFDIPGFAELEPDPDEEPGTLENSAVDTEHYAGGVSYIGERSMVGVAVSRMDNLYGVPGAHHHEDGAEPEAEGGVRIDQGQTRVDIKAALDNPLPGIAELKTRWGHNDHVHKELEGSGEVGTELLNDEWEGRVEAVHEPIGDWNGVLGFQYNQRDFDSSGEEAFVPDSALESFAGFLFEKADYGDWHLDAGLRFEHQDADVIAGTAAARHDLFSLSGGASWEYSEGYQLGLSITRAQRAPSLEELFANGAHLATNTFEIGDAGLDEETSLNFDLHWHKTAGRLGLQANVFYNRIDKFIYLRENDLNGDGFADHVEEDFSGDPDDILPPDETEEPLLVSHVQDDTEFWGFELEATVRLLDDTRGALDLRLWTDYVRGQRTGGSDLPRITPLRFGAGLDWSRAAWSAGVDVMRVAEQDHTAPLETATDGYTMLGLRADYTMDLGPAAWTWFARASNLLDEDARRHTSFLKDRAPLPGLSGVLGVRLSL